MKKRQRIQAWHGRQRSLASVYAVDFASPFHVKARFVPACRAMAALPAGNFCDRRFLSCYAKRFSRSHVENRRSADHDRSQHGMTFVFAP
jgi:hypothetical protein